jgi:hypothetical protein
MVVIQHLVQGPEQTVQAGHADVKRSMYLTTHFLAEHRRFLCRRNIGCTGSENTHPSASVKHLGAWLAQDRCPGMWIPLECRILNQLAPQACLQFRGHPAQDSPSLALQEDARDLHRMFDALALSQDHLWHSLSPGALQIGAHEIPFTL